MQRIKTLSLYIFLVLLGYMPLHIFLSTWLGTSFGFLELAKVLKDIVLVVGFVLVLLASWRQVWFRDFFKDKLVWLVAAYALLTLIFALIFRTDQDAEILAVVYNLRYLLFFLYAALLARLYEDKNILSLATKTVLGVAVLVFMVGIVQYTLLPNDALNHLGYSRSNGVLPAFFIDDKPDLERVMSTLRDPNSFGSYALIIFAIALAYLLKTKNRDVKKITGGILALSLVCIYLTFSRSAWIGAVVAGGAAGLLVLKQSRNIKISRNILLVFVAGVVLLLAGLLVARDTYFVKNVILHADESTVMEDPNQLRLRFWEESLEAAADKPLGYGPGTAGLASIRNDDGVILNENYYFQILHEVGVLGLLLFLSLLFVTGKRLYVISRNNPMAVALLASFAGLAITNFLVHIWSNEAVAYTWWGVAGLVIYKGTSYNKKQTKN